MKKEGERHTQSMEYYSAFKEGTTAICDNMDEPYGYSVSEIYHTKKVNST